MQADWKQPQTRGELKPRYLCVAEDRGDVEAPGALDVHEEAAACQGSRRRGISNEAVRGQVRVGWEERVILS